MSNNNYKVILILVLIGAFILFLFLRKKFKTPVVGSLAVVTGAVKSGKSTFGLHLILRNYKRSLRRYKFRRLLYKCFVFDKSKPFSVERPLLYSNIPLSVPYVPVTADLLLRKKRFAYGSSVYLSEASLLADNKSFRDMLQEERIMFFNKLFGHETKGGLLVYDTQSIADLPAVTRRCLSQMFFVHHLIKWIPFVIVASVRELVYSDDGSVVTSNSTDSDDAGYKYVLMSKRVWKKFDCYCYSSFTDDLSPVCSEVVLPMKSSLKCDKLISFRSWTSVPTDKLSNVEVDEK